MRHSISSFLLAAAVLYGLSSCTNEKKETNLANVEQTEKEIHAQVLDIARQENPSYFRSAREADIEDKIIIQDIYGREHHCIYFNNTSSIIIEKSLPIYCFEYSSKNLSHSL